jgi:hypothetical protein
MVSALCPPQLYVKLLLLLLLLPAAAAAAVADEGPFTTNSPPAHNMYWRLESRLHHVHAGEQVHIMCASGPSSHSGFAMLWQHHKDVNTTTKNTAAAAAAAATTIISGQT